MTRTLEETLQQLKQVEETLLLETLDVSSEELVDRFQDIIEANLDYFNQLLDDLGM